MPVASSRLPGFYKQSVEERRSKVASLASLAPEDVQALATTGELAEAVGDRMIENVIGTYSLPVGVATNFLVDGEEFLIPFVVEEASVVAAASNAAKRCQASGGFRTRVDPPVMIGQVEVRDVADEPAAVAAVEAAEEEIGALCNAQMTSMVSRGGGFRGLEVRSLGERVVCVHLLLDCRDAMGANIVNTVAENLSSRIAELCGGRLGLRILSNLASHRLAKCEATFTADELGGPEVVDGIIEAYRFAALDPFRACTNNKGVMNAVSSVAMATGQDWRAVEAGAHAYCAYKQMRQGASSYYAPLTTWTKNDEGNLIGEIEMPLAVGLVGGAVKVHPAARANVNILGITTAAQLAKVMVAAGLAQNLAALRALATDGIQKGHMKLHARSRADQK